MSDVLKPCPFCGSDNLGSGGDDKIVGYWCKNCQAAGPNHYGKYEWEDRATPTREQIMADERVQALVEAANGVTAFVGYSAHVPEKLDRLYAALDAFKESP